ncbi:MAG TPA: hypothetical protein VMR34_05670 [Candidatus Saccharimonadales bacterium]|nr:hypothetical protein [Candidatus Saccharimonadales bacterium]
MPGPTGATGATGPTGGQGAKNVDKLKPAKIREYAMKNFSLDRVKYLYQAYFEQLYTLWDENGWYSSWDRGVAKYKRYTKYYPRYALNLDGQFVRCQIDFYGP